MGIPGVMGGVSWGEGTAETDGHCMTLGNGLLGLPSPSDDCAAEITEIGGFPVLEARSP